MLIELWDKNTTKESKEKRQGCGRSSIHRENMEQGLIFMFPSVPCGAHGERMSGNEPKPWSQEYQSLLQAPRNALLSFAGLTSPGKGFAFPHTSLALQLIHTCSGI